MDATTSVWQKLEHEHHDRLERDGGFYLGCLNHHLQTMSDTIGDFERMLKLIGDGEEPQVVDLGLLVTRVGDGILEEHPGARLAVRHGIEEVELLDDVTVLPADVVPLRPPGLRRNDGFIDPCGTDVVASADGGLCLYLGAAHLFGDFLSGIGASILRGNLIEERVTARDRFG